MTAYVAAATRWDEGWEIRIEGLGVTQCRTFDQATRQALDYIETLTGEVDATVAVTPELGDAGRRATDAQTRAVAAAKAQVSAAADLRSAVADLHSDLGLSVTDLSAVLGVSRGRVSQLLSGGERALANELARAGSGSTARRRG